MIAVISCVMVIEFAPQNAEELTSTFFILWVQAAERFQQHPKLGQVMSESVGPAPLAFDRQLTMSFLADAPAELEGMFRRGPEWESGVEQILIVEVGHAASLFFLNLEKHLTGVVCRLTRMSQYENQPKGVCEQASSGSSESAAREYVAQLSEVATSPLSGALQSTYGTLQLVHFTSLAIKRMYSAVTCCMLCSL